MANIGGTDGQRHILKPHFSHPKELLLKKVTKDNLEIAIL
jgi:hypothetical protein